MAAASKDTGLLTQVATYVRTYGARPPRSTSLGMRLYNTLRKASTCGELKRQLRAATKDAPATWAKTTTKVRRLLKAQQAPRRLSTFAKNQRSTRPSTPLLARTPGKPRRRVDLSVAARPGVMKRPAQHALNQQHAPGGFRVTIAPVVVFLYACAADVQRLLDQILLGRYFANWETAIGCHVCNGLLCYDPDVDFIAVEEPGLPPIQRRQRWAWFKAEIRRMGYRFVDTKLAGHLKIFPAKSAEDSWASN